MPDYVAGFLFNDTKTQVALIRKNKPAWQAGKFNAIGGHIEMNERSRVAMVREFSEEAGVVLPWLDHFVTIAGNWGSVKFYRTFDSFAFNKIESKTDEQIKIFGIEDIPWRECLPNLSWLIPFALYSHDIYWPTLVMEQEGVFGGD